jgi:hypothetical protein
MFDQVRLVAVGIGHQDHDALGVRVPFTQAVITETRHGVHDAVEFFGHPVEVPTNLAQLGLGNGCNWSTRPPSLRPPAGTSRAAGRAMGRQVERTRTGTVHDPYPNRARLTLT